jgi:hypothetical protein
MADGSNKSTNEHLTAVLREDAARVACARTRELLVTALGLLDATDRSPEEAGARSMRIACLRDELRETVDMYAKTMRAMGELPERVIIAVKAIVDSAVSDVFCQGNSGPQ